MNTILVRDRPANLKTLSEKEVVALWHQLPENTELLSEGGEPIKVIYPGRLNDDRGADFRDAVVATSQGLLKGDIEVHTKASDWRSHGHHLNPAYRRVVLHVAWRDDKTGSEERNIPLVVLNRHVEHKSPKAQLNTGLPCQKVALETILKSLDAAGEKRFWLKADEFRSNLGGLSASQCLYHGIMGALGYVKNKAPFRKLAARLPPEAMESMPWYMNVEEEYLARQQARLFGTAGLLLSQRPGCQRQGFDKWT